MINGIIRDTEKEYDRLMFNEGNSHSAKLTGANGGSLGRLSKDMNRLLYYKER